MKYNASTYHAVYGKLMEPILVTLNRNNPCAEIKYIDPGMPKWFIILK